MCGADTAAERRIEGVTLYEESQLVCTSAGGVDSLELVGRLRSAAGAAEREALLRAELASAGWHWLEHAQVQRRGAVLEPGAMLTTYGPPQWAARYCSQRFWDVDPRVHAAAATGAPHLWTTDGERRREQQAARPRPHALRLIDQIDEAGVGSGMTLVLAAPASAQAKAAVLHLLSPRTDLAWAGSPVLAAGLLLGVSVHHFIVRHTALAAGCDATAGLSALQARIAGCVARGLSDKETARTLDMSRHAVDYHLRVLRSRFKVHNRVQLAQAIGSCDALRGAAVLS